MSQITTDHEREHQIEAMMICSIINATEPEACGRNLAILANVCPPPLHRWFTLQQHQVLAVAMDDAVSGKIHPTADAILERATCTSHSHSLDTRQGKPLRAWQACAYEESALANAGGWAGIADLREREHSFIGTRDVEKNAALLRNAGARRQIIQELRRVAEDVAASDLTAGPYEAVTQSQDRILGLLAGNADRSLGDHLHQALRAGEGYAALRDRGQAPVATWGIRELDDMVPLRPGAVIVLAGAPGSGKTSLMLESGTATAANAGPGAVAIASLEMTGPELASIVAARQVGISPAAIRERSASIPPEAWDRLEALAATWRASSSVLVRDAAGTTDNTTVDGLVAWLTQRRHASPRMALAVLDYLQLLDGTNPRQSEYERITHATRQLKRAAVSLRLPLLVLSQMNRAGRTAVKDRQGQVVCEPEPTLPDLRGSGSIEQDADAVVFLHTIGNPNPTDAAILVRAIVAKNRAGPKGSIDLWFHRRQQCFEVARAPGEDVDFLRSRAARMSSAPHDSEMEAFT